MHEGRQVNAAQTAEALLNLAIKYSPPDQTRLGYPIFVYTLDGGNGLKKIKTVPKGKAVDLPRWWGCIGSHQPQLKRTKPSFPPSSVAAGPAKDAQFEANQ
jgi:hypothetical protein